MNLLDDVKVALRVGHDALDSQIRTSIEACLFDMANKGVSISWLGIDPFALDFTIDGMDAMDLPQMARQAIYMYANVHVLMDNDDAERFERAYDSIVCSLLNSRFNAVYDDDGGDGE